MMTTQEARETISDITADVLTGHGDISLAQARTWAAGYNHWRAACEALTAEEIAVAMDLGQHVYTSSLADDYEDASFADDGESAYGRED